MSVDYRAAIFVGLPREELKDLESFEDWIDAGELVTCPPCYDGNGKSYAIVGYEVYRSGTYCASELNYDPEEVSTMQREFKALTRLDAKVWISPYGY